MNRAPRKYSHMEELMTSAAKVVLSCFRAPFGHPQYVLNRTSDVHKPTAEVAPNRRRNLPYIWPAVQRYKHCDNRQSSKYKHACSDRSESRLVELLDQRGNEATCAQHALETDPDPSLNFLGFARK